MIKKLIDRLKQFGREGLFHIFGSGVLAKMGGLISSVVVIRNLPKAAYGSFVDADNLYAYVAILVGFGLGQAVLQFGSEKVSEERRFAIYRYSLKTGMLGNFLLAVVILILSQIKFLAGERAVSGYLAMMCLLPFAAYIDQYFQIILRVKLENKAFAQTNMIYTVGHVGGNIVLTLLIGVPGLILSQYLAHLIAWGNSVRVLRREDFFRELKGNSLRLERGDRKEILSYGVIYAITNFASTVLVLLDVTCLGVILQDPAILADYKVAATVPQALAFVPKTMMTFFHPKLVRAFSESKREGLGLMKQMGIFYTVINGGIFAGMAVCAPWVVRLIFGPQYTNIVPIFIVLSLNYFINSIRNITGNVIAVLKKMRVNLVFSIVSGVLNIGLNIVLILSMGSMGAALATLSVSVLVLVLNGIYLMHYMKKWQ